MKSLGPQFPLGEQAPAISLWQPWASFLMPGGRKWHETRSWPVPASIQGLTICIHAAAKVPGLDLSQVVEEHATKLWGLGYRTYLPYGAIIGVGRIIDCIPANPENAVDGLDLKLGTWAYDRWAWRIKAIALREPVPCPGHQRIWYPPAHILQAVRRQQPE